MSLHFPPVSHYVLFALLIGMLPVRGAESSDREVKLNGGYYLLHQLCEDEAQVPLLLVVKHAPSEITSYADQIAKTAKENTASLERMQRASPWIQFDRDPLPQIERDTRASIKSEKQHQLLFGTSDSEFVRAFLVAQIEACAYATNLNKVLAEQETDPRRAKPLRHLAAKWLEMRDKAFRILRNY